MRKSDFSAKVSRRTVSAMKARLICAFGCLVFTSLSVVCSVTFAAPLICYVGGDSIESINSRRSRLTDALERLGHTQKEHYSILASSFGGSKANLAPHVAKVLTLRPTIVYAGSWDIANEFKRQTQEVPVVFAARANLESPLFRIVDNLQRPEGNLTGFTRYLNLVPKKLQVLKEAFPATRQVGFIYGVEIRDERRREYEAAANKLGISLSWRKFEKADLSSLSARVNELPDDAFLVAQDDLLLYSRGEYVAQLSKVKRPLIFPEDATDKGILMHYVAVLDGEAKAAEYISKLLRGAKVRDLAVQEPQEFDFSVNVTTLRRLGLTMSRDVLARARKVE